MENSNLPYKYWISAIYYLNEVNEHISALEIQKEFGHKRYEPIWLMLKKIKQSAKKDNAIFLLSDCLGNEFAMLLRNKEVMDIKVRSKFQLDGSV